MGVFSTPGVSGVCAPAHLTRHGGTSHDTSFSQGVVMCTRVIDGGESRGSG
jgi:hypothetical protein